MSDIHGNMAGCVAHSAPDYSSRRDILMYSIIFDDSNFGKLNYYLGAGAEKDGRSAKYPQVDFCKFDVFFSVHGVGPNPNISFPAHSSLHHYMLIV